MKTQVLSVKQMKRLHELGVDTSKASAYYYNGDEKMIFFIDNMIPVNSVLTFTLQDMLEMMPKRIMIEMENDFRKSVEAYFLEVSLNIFNGNWQYGYIHFSKREDCIYFKYENTDLLTCAYETLCWLAENNYIGGKK